MATKYLEAAADYPGSVADAAGNVREIFVDTDTETVQVYDKTNSRWQSIAQPSAKSYTASATLVAAEAGRTILVNAAAGLTLTLPVATGAGTRFRIYVATLLTSVSIIVDVAGSDKFYGGVFINDTGDSTPATADFYPAAGGTSVHLTLAQTAGAGKIGDYIEVVDIGALKWSVSGVISGELDPTTPWS
jgi:hypothetical protein